MNTCFTFDEATHCYTENGIIRPSVTQCLKAEGFINFDGVPPAILERKRRLGTLVHQAAQMWDEGIDLSEFNVPIEVFDYLEGYVNFRDDSGFTPTVVEHGCIGDLMGMRYGMRPDRIGMLNGEEHILELKCGANESPVWGLQLAAYDVGKPDPTRRKRIGLQLGPKFKRGYKLHPYEDPADYHIWQSCLANSIWKVNKKIFVAEDVPEREAA